MTKPASETHVRNARLTRKLLAVLILGAPDDCQVAREEPGRVRKFGRRIRMDEDRDLQFAHSLHLPVPAVHEVSASDGKTHILMDFVDGECLEDAWKSMDEEQKRSITMQLRHILTSMRQVPWDQGKIGAIGGQVRDSRKYTDRLGGPFNTEAEFNDFVLDFIPTTPPLIRNAIKDVYNFTKSRIVFTHGDLMPRNIVKEGCIQALLDWEFAGWYPEYWEYVKFFEGFAACPGWYQYVETIFDTHYHKELATHQALERWQSG